MVGANKTPAHSRWAGSVSKRGVRLLSLSHLKSVPAGNMGHPTTKEIDLGDSDHPNRISILWKRAAFLSVNSMGEST
jgi:hypothetical protein